MQELNRQDQLVEEADTKTEQATTEMKTANSRLKETVTAVVQAFDMISSIASH
jgi:methyl-accepting chemotaxis protein